jgi:adenylate kinase family enzyme
MKLLVCIAGHTGAGKTTLARAMSMAGFPTFISGDLFRKKYAGRMENEDSSVAPSQFDAELLGHVLDFVRESEVEGEPFQIAVVETMPRHTRQVKWLKRIADETGWLPVVVMLTATRELCESRVRGRDMTDPVRLKRDLDKITEEWTGKESVNSIYRHIVSNGFSVQVRNTEEFPVDQGHATRPATIGLAHMATISHNLYMEKHVTTADALGRMDAQHLLGRCGAEVQEAIHESEGPGADRGKCLEEIVDSLWFLLLAVKALGYGTDDLVAMYMNKAAINGHREDTDTKPMAAM